MECLETTLLALYLDNALDTQTAAEVMGHLATCQHCQGRLEELQERELLALSVFPDPAMQETTCAGNYTAEELSGYLSRALSAREEARIERHLRDCQACRSSLMAMRSTVALLQSAPLLTPPAALLHNVRHTLHASPVKALGAFVIQIMQHSLRFVEALRLPQDVQVLVHGQMLPAGAFRSAATPSAAVTHVDIQQKTGEVALLLNMLHVENATVMCTIGLQRHGAPLVRRRVVLSRANRRLYAGATSGNGEIESLRLGPGEYTVQIPQENIETQFILRADDQAA